MDFIRLSKFALSTKLHDVILEFKNSNGESAEFPAHKLILSGHSNFLFHLFEYFPNLTKVSFPAFLDSNERKTDFEDLKSLLRFLYSNDPVEALQNRELSVTNALNYFVGARLMGLDSLEHFLSKFIMEHVLVGESLVRNWMNAVRFNDSEWKTFMIERVASRFEEVVAEEEKEFPSCSIKELGKSVEKSFSDEKLLRVPFKYFKNLIQRNDLKVEKEETVLTFVLKYIEEAETEEEKDEQVDESEKERFYLTEELFSTSYHKKHFEEKKEKSTSRDPTESEQDNSDITTEENNHLQFHESSEVDLSKYFALEKWNSNGEKLVKRSKLSETQKRELLQEVRFAFVEHSTLVGLSGHPIFKHFSDILLEALSAKLNRYEETKMKYKINCQSRDNFKSKSKLLLTGSCQESIECESVGFG